MMGYPDRAAERATEALALAAELDHPFTSAFARFHSGLIHLWRREPDIALDRAISLLEMADEHDFRIWTAAGTCLLGAAQVGLDRFDEGLANVRTGVDLYQGMRSPPVFWPMLLFVSAAANLRAGRPADAIALDRQGDRVHERGRRRDAAARAAHPQRRHPGCPGAGPGRQVRRSPNRGTSARSTAPRSSMPGRRGCGAATRLARLRLAEGRPDLAIGHAWPGPRDVHGRIRHGRRPGGQGTPRRTPRGSISGGRASGPCVAFTVDAAHRLPTIAHPAPQQRRRPDMTRPGTMALAPLSCSSSGRSLVAGPLASTSLAQDHPDQSDVVLVLDFSASILDDPVNRDRFAAALDRIADRVDATSADLVAGDTTVTHRPVRDQGRRLPGVPRPRAARQPGDRRPLRRLPPGGRRGVPEGSGSRAHDEDRRSTRTTSPP